MVPFLWSGRYSVAQLFKKDSSMSKKALIVQGGWDGHEPKQVSQILGKQLEANGFAVEISDTLDAYLDKAKMAAWDLVVPCWTMGKISNDQWKGLNEAVT